MKKFLLILVAVCCLLSCKKETVTGGLIGKWELRHMSGSIVGFDSTYSAGNGRILQFKSDSTYQRFNQGKLISQGAFHIVKNTSPTGIYANEIDLNGYTQYMNLNGTQLSIGQDIDDGVASDYVKVGN